MKERFYFLWSHDKNYKIEREIKKKLNILTLEQNYNIELKNWKFHFFLYYSILAFLTQKNLFIALENL